MKWNLLQSKSCSPPAATKMFQNAHLLLLKQMVSVSFIHYTDLLYKSEFSMQATVTAATCQQPSICQQGFGAAPYVFWWPISFWDCQQPLSNQSGEHRCFLSNQMLPGFHWLISRSNWSFKFHRQRATTHQPVGEYKLFPRNKWLPRACQLVSRSADWDLKASQWNLTNQWVMSQWLLNFYLQSVGLSKSSNTCQSWQSNRARERVDKRGTQRGYLCSWLNKGAVPY